MPARPVIALLTDFGTTDHYVGVMKGVIAGICPDATVIDITHEVPPQDVRSAAVSLASSWRYFPDGTIFVAVVDPGVGTSRPAVAARIGGSYFIGPDNGVFDLVLAAQAPTIAVTVDNPRYARARISETFEGRDRFAPAAAWLARGVALGEFGSTASLSMRLDWPLPRVHTDRVVGQIVHVDHFGNLVTNLERSPWAPLLERADLWVAGHGPIRTVRTYGDAAANAVVALFGSTDRLEIAVVGGSAAATLRVTRGVEVHAVWRA